MVCLTVCLSYCMIVCLFYANSAAKILLFLHICKQNPKNMQNLPISALFCFIVLYSALFCFIVVSFFISVAYLRQFFPALFLFSVFPALFPFSSFFFYRQIVFAALLCPLRRDLIPTKTPPKSPFRPENLIILTFPSPKICIYQKKCVPLHRKVRIGAPDGRKRSASGGESGGIGCPFI